MSRDTCAACAAMYMWFALAGPVHYRTSDHRKAIRAFREAKPLS